MAFPPQFLDEIRARVPLAGVIGRKVRLVKRGREYSGLCPFHNEKSPSFTVNEEKGFFHCFGCGAHGDVISFAMRNDGLSFPEAVERLAADAGLPVPETRPEDRQRAEQQSTLLGAMEAAAKFFEAELRTPRGKTARDYLIGRGLTGETAARFRLGYAPDTRNALKEALGKAGFDEALLIEGGLLIKPEDGGASYDRFRGRAMFPIADRRGRVIAFGGRVMGDGTPKYLNSPETPLFHKGRVLFGLAQAGEAIRKAGEVIVAEGYMDVIALAEAGVGQAVAPLGTALTEEQLALLWRLAPEPVLCFDGDGAGERAAQRAAERALPLLQPGCSLRFALLPAGEDPDSLVRKRGAQAFREIVGQALPLVEVLWRIETAGRPVDTPERRAGLRQRLRAQAARIAERTVQEDYRLEFDRRLEAAFGLPGRRSGYPPSTNRPGQGFRRGRGPWQPPFEVGGTAARQGMGDAAERQAELLLLIAVRHPLLAAHHLEELAKLTFGDAQLDKLRQSVIDHAAGRPDLDAEGLRHHLSREGYSDLLDTLTTKNKDQKFAQPEAPVEQAEEAFDHLVGLIRERGARTEAALAAERLMAEGTDEALARFQAAQQASLTGESRRRDMDERMDD
ncbi:MAG: DNA primase [Dongiaceae bacterium]